MVQRLKQIGPGLVTQETLLCDKCKGDGTVFKEKDKCKKCKGKKTVSERKLLEIYIPRGAKYDFWLICSVFSPQRLTPS